MEGRARACRRHSDDRTPAPAAPPRTLRSPPQSGRGDLVEQVLVLQRTVGNQATSTLLLQRSEVTAGAAATVKFWIGPDLSLTLALRAWAETLSGALDDRGVAVLREVALESDETIDDNERMFIAALLEPGNAKKWHAEHLWPGGAVEFDVASITAANRARVREFGRGTTPTRVPLNESKEPGAVAAALAQDIVDLAGPFAATARDALAIADQANVSYKELHSAMLSGASDSTPGDRAFAGAVYVIARQERLSVAGDLLAGRVKVDQVPGAALYKTKRQSAAGMYQPSATAGGRKGDTLYLPSDLQFLSLAGQGVVVHELAHAADDAAAESPRRVPVVEAELSGFRAEARFYLNAIAKRSGPARDRAVEEIAKAVTAPALLCAVLEATEILGNETALAALKDLHSKVLDPDVKVIEFNALLQGLADEDRHYDTTVELEKRISQAIKREYRHIDPAQDDAFRGESVLDVGSGAGQ